MFMEGVKSGNENEVIVLVDTDASKENVSRAAESKNYSVTIQQQGDEYRLTIIK
jgi:tRNA 2-thiouridine synthesizing protein A